MAPSELSPHQARQVALRAQNLDRRRPMALPRLLEQLGAVQLDTISVLARSHELVPYARLGAVGRHQVEAAYWGQGRTFEYWSHAACILPVSRFPYFAFRRRAFMAKQAAWGVSPAAVRVVRSALLGNGPQTATELGGARRSSGWWEWSEAKNAVEWMLAVGEVVVTDRRSWKRVYDLAERAIPSHPTDDWVDDRGVVGPSDAACLRHLLLVSMRTLGVGTVDDIRDVHRLRGDSATKGRHAGATLLQRALQALVESGEIVRASVQGWDDTVHADPAALRRIPADAQSVTTLLSPFDSLVWHRPRLERLFDHRHRIEAYTPAVKRQYGYFAMPVLHGGRIIGLVDPGREKDMLVVKQATSFDGDESGIALAVAEAARWVGASAVRVDRAGSAAAARRLQQTANGYLSSA
jgi:uncharacterized protein YcaQ